MNSDETKDEEELLLDLSGINNRLEGKARPEMDESVFLEREGKSYRHKEAEERLKDKT